MTKARMLLLAVLVFTLALGQAGFAQDQANSELLTNDDVIEMVEAGLSAEIVLATLESCGCQFKTSTSALVALAKAGVPNDVIYSMVAIANRKVAAPVELSTPAAGPPPEPLPPVESLFFPKTKHVVQNGDKDKEIEIALVITGGSILLKHRKQEQVFATIPFDTIQEITYERSSHARIKTAILLSPWALFSKGKKHWLTVTYKVGDVSDFVLLKLDKKEYKRILAATEARTGQTIERIIDN